MKRAPSEYTLNYLMYNLDLRNNETEINGKWVPARPFGLFSLRNRLRLAWKVFTGKADVFTWPEGQ